MESRQATEHLDIVSDILHRAEFGNPPAVQFIVWGIVGVAFNIAGQLVTLGKAGPQAFWVAGVVLALALVVSIWDMSRTQRAAGRLTTIGRLAAVSFWTAAAVMGTITILSEMTKLFPPFAPSVLFAAGMSTVLLTLGFGLRFRPLALGGLALLGSIVIAFLIPSWLGAIIAAGNVAGFIVPGVLFAVTKTDG